MFQFGTGATMTTAPRCSACDRFAIVEIEDGFFLCARCHTILKREFPHVGRQFTDPAVPTPATAATESASNAVAELISARPVASPETASRGTTELPDGASTSASEDIAFPEIPEFLRRAVA